MEINLPPQFERMLRREKEAGGHPDIEHVIMRALLMMRDRQGELDAWEEENRESILEKIDEGLAELDRGEYAEFDAEEIIREGRARLAAKRAKRSVHEWAE